MNTLSHKHEFALPTHINLFASEKAIEQTLAALLLTDYNLKIFAPMEFFLINATCCIAVVLKYYICSKNGLS